MIRRLLTISALLGGAGALLAFPSQIADLLEGASSLVRGVGAVNLPTSYPGEVWYPAKPEQLSWIVGAWCAGNVPGFRSTFRLASGGLDRMNTHPVYSPTGEWVHATAYVNNQGLIRLWYDISTWPGDYITQTPTNLFGEWTEYQRGMADDGTIQIAYGPHSMINTEDGGC